MDKFEEALKNDAAAIRAEISPELDARLRASVQAAAPVPKSVMRQQSGFRWWLLSSLAGAAAAVILLVVVIDELDDPASVNDVALPRVADTPDAILPPMMTVPLDVRTAEFTEPLADELDRLKSDIEKAREKLESDLRFTL